MTYCNGPYVQIGPVKFSDIDGQISVTWGASPGGSSANFTIIDSPSLTIPDLPKLVGVYDGGSNLLFAGVALKKTKNAQSAKIQWQIECQDLSWLASQRVLRSYSNIASLEDHLLNLIAHSCPPHNESSALFTYGIHGDPPDMFLFEASEIPLAEALDKLVDEIGWLWWVEPAFTSLDGINLSYSMGAPVTIATIHLIEKGVSIASAPIDISAPNSTVCGDDLRVWGIQYSRSSPEYSSVKVIGQGGDIILGPIPAQVEEVEFDIGSVSDSRHFPLRKQVSSVTVVEMVPVTKILSFTPSSGPEAASVEIDGLNFTGASAVEFNGVSASFSVVDDTTITATVPVGATTGKITVTTTLNTATSIGDFTVTV